MNMKETAQTVAAWLQQIKGDRQEDSSGQGLEAYMGEGLPPVPQKLVERIQKGEFVKMCELLPEFWIAPREGEDMSGLKTAKSKGRKHTQEICVWLQCFAVYVAVMSARWPKRVPEMMAYMIHIIKTSQEYEGVSWFIYDEAYRRQAAVTKHVEWSRVNPSIFTVCFTSKAKRGQRCEWCLSATHGSSECALAEVEANTPGRPRTVEPLMGATQAPGRSRAPPVGYQFTNVCKLFNEGRCHYQFCKFRHTCIVCQGDHPAVANPDCAMGGQRGSAPAGPMQYNPIYRGIRQGRPY